MRKRTDQPDFLQNILFGSISAALGAAVTLFLCFLMSLMISGGVIGATAAEFSFLTTIPGAILCGFMTARHAQKRLLLFGLIGGALLFLLLLLIGLLLLPTHSLSGNLAALLGCILCGSFLGSFLAARR